MSRSLGKYLERHCAKWRKLMDLHFFIVNPKSRTGQGERCGVSFEPDLTKKSGSPMKSE